jgi:regulator of protease activity HflC (stomatin/prohibitin superfamily)
MSDQLKPLYAQIDKLNDEIPAQQARKITLYAKCLQWIGKYHADAVLAHGMAYADRKRIYGDTIQQTEGTAVDKQAKAETESYEARIREADAEAEAEKWKRLFISTEHIINALKIEHKTLMNEYNDKVG